MPFIVSGTGPEGLPSSSEEVDKRRKARLEKKAAGISKKKKKPSSVTENMSTVAEQLWSAKTRGLIDFEPISATKRFFGMYDGLPIGGIGLVPGQNGGKGGFESYIKQEKVIKRLQEEGF